MTFYDSKIRSRPFPASNSPMCPRLRRTISIPCHGLREPAPPASPAPAPVARARSTSYQRRLGEAVFPQLGAAARSALTPAESFHRSRAPSLKHHSKSYPLSVATLAARKSRANAKGRAPERGDEPNILLPRGCAR